jgi:tRNA threonylcarbamoyladenosine biosynthesis protein TsaE
MIVATEAEMKAFGKNLSSQLKAGDWVAIDGPLGAGKTVLCAGVLYGLGFAGEVASPSYAIVHEYRPPEVIVPVVHADLYRLNNYDEIEELGLLDSSDDCITLIEWAKNANDDFGRASHKITIESMDNGNRKITMVKKDG